MHTLEHSCVSINHLTWKHGNADVDQWSHRAVMFIQDFTSHYTRIALGGVAREASGVQWLIKVSLPRFRWKTEELMLIWSRSYY